MQSFSNFIKGIFIGAGAILPGISSGVLCIIFGIYEKLIDSILGFFKDIKKNLKFLIPIALGGFFGCIIFSNILVYFFDAIPIQTKSLFIGLKQECFYCLYLDTKKNLIERKLLFMGTIDKSLIHPREVFKNAYLCSASSIICLHNHPSGDVLPSKADIEITKSLIKIGNIQGIQLVDHIIISENNYFSFFENNLME